MPHDRECQDFQAVRLLAAQNRPGGSVSCKHAHGRIAAKLFWSPLKLSSESDSGRVRGFVPWLIAQRPAVLHKAVLSQADILVSMKLTSSQDRAALGALDQGPGGSCGGPPHPGRLALARPRRGLGMGAAR